jgi:hypothetical protein
MPMHYERSDAKRVVVVTLDPESVAQSVASSSPGKFQSQPSELPSETVDFRVAVLDDIAVWP